MKIEHVALWTTDLERSRNFYQTYFSATANGKYINEKKQFESYFLTFASGARLELMSKPNLVETLSERLVGWAHIAISLGSREAVRTLTSQIEADGYTVASQPRVTGDGYYESVVLDPDGNQIELTV